MIFQFTEMHLYVQRINVFALNSMWGLYYNKPENPGIILVMMILRTWLIQIRPVTKAMQWTMERGRRRSSRLQTSVLRLIAVKVLFSLMTWMKVQSWTSMAWTHLQTTAMSLNGKVGTWLNFSFSMFQLCQFSFVWLMLKLLWRSLRCKMWR